MSTICTKCMNLGSKGVLTTLGISNPNLFCNTKQMNMNNLNVKSCDHYKPDNERRNKQSYESLLIKNQH